MSPAYDRTAGTEADAEMACYQQLEAIDQAMNRGPEPRWTGEAEELLAALACQLGVESDDVEATWRAVKEALPDGFGTTVEALAEVSLRVLPPAGRSTRGRPC